MEGTRENAYVVHAQRSKTIAFQISTISYVKERIALQSYNLNLKNNLTNVQKTSSSTGLEDSPYAEKISAFGKSSLVESKRFT